MTSSSLNSILNQWTGHAALEAIETNELEQWTLTHPYSPVLQLLLAKKYEMVASPLYPAQLQKTSAYFPSNLPLHGLLQGAEEDAISAPIETKLVSILSDQLAQFKEPLQEEAPLTFAALTPLQRDYFAAQGIEIDLSTVTQDKFTKQLRSFTAWLKVLKNKDGIPQMAEIGIEQEKLIAAIAEKANATADVITEAMAEVWLKQGNKRKAIDVYSKLSFIFPEKSVYFASRIEQLKQRK